MAAAALVLLLAGAAAGWTAAAFLPQDAAAAAAAAVLAAASGAAGWAARSVVRRERRGEEGSRTVASEAARKQSANGDAAREGRFPEPTDGGAPEPGQASEAAVASEPAPDSAENAAASGASPASAENAAASWASPASAEPAVASEALLAYAEPAAAGEVAPESAEPAVAGESAPDSAEPASPRTVPSDPEHIRAKDGDGLPIGGEALAAELRLALEIQRRWQPPLDLRLGACLVTARSRQAAEVGGDLFDAVVLDDAFVAVLVGDVPGKGLQAAFMVPALLLLFRSEVKRGGGPAELLGRMNRVLAGLRAEGLTENIVSLGVGLLDVKAGEMRYAGAGHPAPYLVRPGAAPRQLDSSSLPLGMNADETYRETVFRFAPGERFVLYTDGVIEDACPDGEMYGFDRFEREMAEWTADMTAADWMERLLDGQDGSRAFRRDDRTLLVVEYAGGKAGRRTELRERSWILSSAVGCERSVAAELAAMLRDVWADSGRTDDIVTCVAEAVMNAAEHGNGFDTEKMVAVHVHFGQAIMVCRVRDEGTGFDPEAFRSARTTGGRDQEDGDYGRGWGLRLIDELTDYWIATRDHNGFCVEMYFLSQQRKS